MEKRSGTCPVCGRPYQLTQNGYLRKHWKRDGQGKGLPFSDPCAGSGNLPVLEDAVVGKATEHSIQDPFTGEISVRVIL